MVYSTRRYVLKKGKRKVQVVPCVILLLYFFSSFSIAITSFGEEKANLSAFLTFVRFGLFGFVCYLFLFVSGMGLRLWHSLDFSLTFLVSTMYCV